MEYRLFKLFNSTELSYISDRTKSAVKRWSEQWLNKPELVDVDVFPAEEIAEYLSICPTEWLVGEYGQHMFALCWSENFIDELYENITNTFEAHFHKPKHTTYLSRHLVNINIGSLADSICKLFYGSQDSIKTSYTGSETFLADASTDGSGYVIVDLILSKQNHLLIALNLSSINRTEKTEDGHYKSELEPAINAFGNHTVKIEALIGNSIIDIHSLSNMSVGDVLTIDARLESSIDLFIDNNKICTGRLGKKDNRFAVKIEN